MILRFRQEGFELSLGGESFGRTVRPEELRRALRLFFAGWREVVLEGRGVLQVLQGISRGIEAPHLVYSIEIRQAAAAFPLVLKLVAAGRVSPVFKNGDARWVATLLPAGYPPDLIHALTDCWMRTCAGTTLSRAQVARAKFYSADDAWLAALRSPEAHVKRTEGLPEGDLIRWAAPLFEGDRAHLPLTPRRTETGWVIQFGNLQVAQDYAQLRLLGQAIAVSPMLALPQPWSDDRFLLFLREAVPALRAAAFSVLLPPELESSVPEVRESAVALADDEITVSQRITVAGVEVSPVEAQAILDAGESLVFLKGAWRYVDLEALRRILETLGPERLSKHRALPLLLAGVIRVAPEASEIQAFLRNRLQPPAGDLPLRDILRPYQAQGVCWLMQAAAQGLGVCLADDMGLGKTVQTIAFLQSRRTPPGPALVVAPLTVLPVWERELNRFAPGFRVLRHDGPERLHHPGFEKVAQASDVVLTAYGYLWRDYTTLRRVKWSTLVLDEAQQIKNPATRQSQAARSLPAAFRLALTGTPIENSLDDLWSLLDFLNPDLFGPRKDFAMRYADPEKLRRAVSHFLLRRLKSDPSVVSELPGKIQQEHYAPLTDLQAAAYDLALAEYTREAQLQEKGSRTGSVLALLTRLKQICVGVPDVLDGGDNPAEYSGKVLVLLPLLDEILACGESALIFTQFVRMGETLQRILAERLGRPIPFVHGGLTAKQRRAEIDAFNTTDAPLPLILSLRTGAFGLTLTKANHVIHLDRWWNPAVEAQATDRAHRIGQRKTVIVHHLLCRGTLEERIDALLREKRDLAETIVAATPAALLAKLPADTLLGLLKRAPDSAEG